jgi:hypothetical protein
MPHHLPAHQDKVAAQYAYPREYYQTNWEPDFSCPLERMVGSLQDGHKWVCNPHRLAELSDCVIYSLGSNGNFEFERALLQIAPNCEIHVFDPGNYGTRIARQSNIHYHQIGLQPSYDTDPILTNSTFQQPSSGTFQTLQQMITDLGHTGRTISIFKIDIEGGEWTTFRDWLTANVLLQQILVEVHNTPPIVNDFFVALHQAGYAMFHKEPNIFWSGGDCIEFSFVKFRPSFWEGDTMPVQHHRSTSLLRQKQQQQQALVVPQKRVHRPANQPRVVGAAAAAPVPRGSRNKKLPPPP